MQFHMLPPITTKLGIFLPFNKLKKLKKGEYYVNVDSVFNNNGSLTFEV